MNEQECNVKGGKLVDGKCEMPNSVPSTSGFKSKKKSNSPFKMWGSYLGLILGGAITHFWIIPTYLSECYSVPVACGGYLIISLPIGFILGWITSIVFRRYRK